MSVLSHLTDTASKAVLSSAENLSISTSISTLQSRLASYFGSDVTEHFKFGSYTRETILPRSVDPESDIDYMVVFKDGGSKPQTYLDRLKRFVDNKYSSSEIYQSSPTIVLNLSHIRFELVPALKLSYGGGYNIPAPASNWQDWITTYPNAFNESLLQANKSHSYNIKPVVRLVKYWNTGSARVFNSFSLEEYVVKRASYQNSLKDYLYWAIESLSVDWDAAQWRKDKMARAKEIVKNTKEYERQNYLSLAEAEIKKLVAPIT
jgi:hypothetical protein